MPTLSRFKIVLGLLILATLIAVTAILLYVSNRNVGTQEEVEGAALTTQNISSSTPVLKYSAESREVFIRPRGGKPLDSEARELMSLPEGSEIMGEQVVSEDGTLIAFSTLTRINYMRMSTDGLLSGGGWGSVVSNAWIYNTVTGKTERLFSNADLHGSYEYPVPDAFSSDKSLIAFSAYGCWNCGGHKGETVVVSYDEENPGVSKVKNLGRTAVFKFLDNGMYQYSETVQVLEGCEAEVGGCWTNGPLRTQAF